MLYDHISPGFIYELPYPNKLVVVIALPKQGQSSYARVCPVSFNHERIAQASAKEVLIPYTESPLRLPLLVSTWHARTISPRFLGRSLGTIAPHTVDIITQTEMSFVVPNMVLKDISYYPKPQDISPSSEARSAQSKELEQWDYVWQGLSRIVSRSP